MKYFGTDGIRMPAEKFTPEFINSVVYGLSRYAEETGKRVLIGGDTRESSEWILQDLAAALESAGFDYASVGVLPTPAINYCFYAMRFDYAIDVTASHNPFYDNGIKIFERGVHSGIKLSSAGREEIEKAISEGARLELVSTTDREDLSFEAISRYREMVLEYLGEVDFSRLKIGMDCANGAVSVIAGSIFEELGAKVEVICADSRYGRGINDGCGSTHLEMLKSLVLENGLDFGVAFDGDGDRCLLVDAEGRTIDGDEIIVILAEYLGLDAVAVTVMANQGLMNWAFKRGIRTEVTAVGDANVAEAMKLNAISLGGEQSGHIILPGQPTGDGILTSLMVAKAVMASRRSLAELAAAMKKLPQVMVNVEASAEQKEALKSSEVARKVLLEYDEKLKAVSGRLLVRPSGTEALIRITMWGDNLETISRLSEELAGKLKEIL